MVYALPSTCPRKWHTQTPMGLWHTHGSLNLVVGSYPSAEKQSVYSTVPADWATNVLDCDSYRVRILIVIMRWSLGKYPCK